MTERSIAHGSFTIERTYPVKPEKVWLAWSELEQKQKWFGSPAVGNAKHTLDFQVGGKEHSEGSFPDGTLYTFDVIYQDIIDGQRIVYSYDMTINGHRISVSLATIEIAARGAGTHLTVTEHGAYLDGLDNSAQRRDGTEQLMDALGTSLGA
ncbi:MAG: hypothetical protein JWR75_1811 [Devosia sp.]|nr:hypothetical protein [Devosia sp.]